MEETKNLVVFIVIASSSGVLLLMAIVFDLFSLFQKRKVIARQEIEIREKKIDELILKNEVENINALLKGQSSERERISQDLHDKLGSILFTAKLHHGNLEKKFVEFNQDQHEGFEKLLSILDEAVYEVRRISHDLRASAKANFGFTVALRQLCATLQESGGLKITTDVEEEVDTIKQKIQYELFAITQELLSNTLKHANATEITIELRIEDSIIFQYHDNGKGFDTGKTYSGIGSLNLQKRTEKVNGELTVESSVKSGTFYYLTAPLES